MSYCLSGLEKTVDINRSEHKSLKTGNAKIMTEHRSYSWSNNGGRLKDSSV